MSPRTHPFGQLAGRDDTTPTKIAISVNDRDAKVFDVYAVDLLTGARTLIAENDDGFAGFTLDVRLRPRAALKSLPDGSNEIYITDDKPTKDGKRS